MSSDQKSWWNWGVLFFTALGTIGAVLVALFQVCIRGWLADLRIELSTAPGEGEKAKVWLTPPGGKRETLSRWFHVKVENRRWKFVTATEVRLWMLELKIQNAAGDWTTDWMGELPFGWKDQIVKLPTLSMGQPDEADLCCVIKDYQGTGQHVLRLTPVIQKSPPQTEWAGACHIQVKFQARSVETVSNIIAIQIDWNGTWDDDDTRMRQQHLQVNQVPVPSRRTRSKASERP